MAASDTSKENQPPQDPRAMTPGQRLAAEKEAKARRKAARKGGQPQTAAQLAENVSRASSWASENKALIWAVVLAVVVIGVGLTAWRIQSEQSAAAAAAALDEGAQALLAPLESEAGADVEGQKTYPSRKARAETALEELRAVISSHPGSQAARWAHAGKGNALLTLDKPGKALQAFEQAYSEQGSVDLRVRALEGQGFALEAQDKLAEAEARFARITELGEGDYAPLGSYHVGRMALARDEKERAVQAFSKALDTLEQAAEDEDVLKLPYVKEQAELRLLELEPSAVPDAPGGAGPGFQMPGGAKNLENLPPELIERLRKASKSSKSSSPSGQAEE